MKKQVSGKDIAIVVSVALVWTLVVIAFSTTMGSRPLRIYDWGPPAFACLVTLVFMLKDRGTKASRSS
jgi:hypothetical protein